MRAFEAHGLIMVLFLSLSLFPGELLKATTSGKTIAETHIWLVYTPNRTSSNLAFFVVKGIQTHYTVPPKKVTSLVLFLLFKTIFPTSSSDVFLGNKEQQTSFY